MPHVRELFDLRGKVALVTGGSRGLGLEIAEGLGEAGATVIITARREQWLGPAEEGLRGAGLAVEAAVCDVTDPAAVGALIDGIVARHGALDVVVNNAGVSWGRPPRRCRSSASARWSTPTPPAPSWCRRPPRAR